MRDCVYLQRKLFPNPCGQYGWNAAAGGRQIDRQTGGRQTDGLIDKQIDSQSNRQTDRQTDKQTDRQTNIIRQMNYSGLIIAVITFLVIGLFHPLVIKSEYYFGTKCWWAFALAGMAFIVASLLVENSVASPILGVVGCSCLWSILEIFEQRERVRKGWFPMNPKRKSEY